MGSLSSYRTAATFTFQTVLTFSGGPIDPSLDIDAQYVVTNYTIDVFAGGAADKPTLQLKSQPKLSQADILSLVLFGETTEALRKGEQADFCASPSWRRRSELRRDPINP